MSERFRYNEYTITIDMNDTHEINIIDNEDLTEMYFKFDDLFEIVDMIKNR